jgi:hypothetical protein
MSFQNVAYLVYNIGDYTHKLDNWAFMILQLEIFYKSILLIFANFTPILFKI